MKETWEHESRDVVAKVQPLEFPKIAYRPLKELIEAFDQWVPADQLGTAPSMTYKSLKESGVLLRIFMAYVGPGIENSEDYNRPRIRLFTRWLETMDLEGLDSLAEKGQFSILQTVFSDWVKCMEHLKISNQLQESDMHFAEDITRQREALEKAKSDKQSKLKILRKWEFVFADPDWMVWKKKKRESRKSIQRVPEEEELTNRK